MGWGLRRKIRAKAKAWLRDYRYAVRTKRRMKDLRWLRQNAHERMDAELDIFDEPRRRFHITRYRFACRYSRDKVVMDFASGTGYGVRMLRSEGGAAKVVGLDCSSIAIAYARRYHLLDHVEYHCQDAQSLNLPGHTFDLVTSFETLEHVPDDRGMLQNVVRHLRPGGKLIISTPNNWPHENHPYHVRSYDAHSFRGILTPFFHEVEMYNQNSGCDSEYNHGQPVGIIRTSAQNFDLAECFIAVCTCSRS